MNETLETKSDTRPTRHAKRRLSHGKDATTVKTSPRTKTFQAFMDSLKTSPRKVTKLSLDYATRR